MSRSPARKRLEWSEIGVLGVLGGLVVFGFAANGLSLLQSVVCLGFVAGVLAIAWLWRLTLERADAAPPPTCRQVVVDAVLFLGWLAVVGALAWWCWQRSAQPDHVRSEGAPAAGFPNASDDPPVDDAQPGPPGRPAPFKMLPSGRVEGGP